MEFLAIFFIFTIILFGLLAILPYNDNIKKRIMKISAIIYNLIFGFYHFWFFCALTFIAAGSKMSQVIKYIVIYLSLLLVNNILFKVRGKISIKKYLLMSAISTLIGIVIYFILLFILDIVGYGILF